MPTHVEGVADPAMVAVIPTSPYHGYSILFSPFSPGRIAFVGGLNYGIAGTGALIIFDHSPQGFKELRRYVITCNYNRDIPSVRYHMML